MNICIVNGSPRKNGNSDYIAKNLSSISFDGDVSVLNLTDMNFSGCQGCRKCRINKSLCVVDDDVSSVLSRIVNSDIVIIISPNYYGFITGQMKLFLDRWFCLKDESGNTKFKNNGKLFFIMPQGSPDRNHGETANGWMKKVSEGFSLKYFSYVIPGCKNNSLDIAKMKFSDIKMHINMIV